MIRPAYSKRKAQTRPAPLKSIKMLLSQQRRLEREFRRLEERAKKWQHGGQCVRAGAPPGNQNARKSQLMPTPWPEKLAEKMGQPEGFWAFLP